MERCIRAARKLLVALLRHQTVDDECLTTIMCEVESIVNSRPYGRNSNEGNYAIYDPYDRTQYRETNFL